MRIVYWLLPGLLALAAPIPLAAEEGKRAAPRNALTGTDCLTPRMARSWEYVSADEVLVDAGRRKYRIRLADSCPELGQGAVAMFEGSRPHGRVCGNTGEAVRAERKKCRIASVELIDAQTYRDIASGKGGQTPSTGD